MLSIKQLLTVLLFISLSTHLLAQSSSNIFGGISLAVLDDIGEGSENTSMGVAYKLNLGYKINKKLNVGIEHLGSIHSVGQVQFTDIDGNPVGTASLNYRASTYIVKSHYKFKEIKEAVYVFGGVGLGLSQFVSPDLPVSQLGNEVTKQSSFSYLANAEIGLSAHGFTVSVFANYGTKSQVELNDFHGGHYNYLGASFGYIWNF